MFIVSEHKFIAHLKARHSSMSVIKYMMGTQRQTDLRVHWPASVAKVASFRSQKIILIAIETFDKISVLHT